MLDGADAREHRVSNSLVAVAMAHDAAAQAPGGADHGADRGPVVHLDARVLLRQARRLGSSAS